jgi:hypothetical protein
MNEKGEKPAEEKRAERGKVFHFDALKASLMEAKTME